MLASDRIQTRVGAATLALFAIGLLVTFVFGGVDFGERIPLSVEFDHVGALREGADVQIAGRVVGTVVSISLGERGATAHVELDGDYASWAPSNAEVFVASKGLLSNRYIEIGPPANGATPAEPIKSGATLRGISPVRVEMVVLRSIENTKQFRALLIELRPVVRTLLAELDALAQTLEEIEGDPGRFASLRKATSSLLDELSSARDLAAQSNLSVARISATAARATRVADSASNYLTAIGKDIELLAADLGRLQRAASAETLVKLGLAIARAQRLLKDYRATAEITAAIMARIERGEGTIGGLLHDPEFIDEAKQLGRIIKRQPWRLFGTNREKLDSLEP